MAKFIHSVMAQNESVTAGTTITYDLPVNPLSFILLTLKFAQDQANTQLTFANIPLMLSKIEILFKGSAVYSLNGIDALASALLINQFETWSVNADGADNDLRSFTFLVSLSRKMYDPNEAFPRSTRGELQLQVTYASSFTQIDAVTAQIETVELPDANPRQYMRQTTLSRTPSATGDVDIDLPIGNKISELILFGTTIPAGSTATRTIEFVQLLIDNQQEFYSKINFESLHNMAGRLMPPPGYYGSHTHQTDQASYAQFQDVTAVDAGDHILKNHLVLPFDMLRDGMYMLETAGLSDLVLRVSAGDTNAIRVMPVEIIEL